MTQSSPLSSRNCGADRKEPEVPTPRTSPQFEVALWMMRKHVDPRVIISYLKREVQRDPTITMTPLEAASFRFQREMSKIGEGLKMISDAIESVPGGSR